MSEALGSVVIGPKEIYDAVQHVSSQMELMQQQMAEQGRRGDDHEARLRSLEKGRWPLPSLAVLISIASVVTLLLTR